MPEVKNKTLEQKLLQLSHATRIFPSGEDRIYWMTESKQGVWSSSHVGTLVSLLAEPAGADTILQHFATGVERDSAAKVLDEMIARGLVEPIPDDPFIANLCREFGVDTQQLKRKRHIEGAKILAVDAGAGEALAAALASVGVPVRDGGGLQVVVVTDYLDSRVEQVHSECQAKTIPWMPTKLTGEEVWVGPIFRPGITSCWRCLTLRLRERRWLQNQLPYADQPWCDPYTLESRLRAAAEFAAYEVARWLCHGPGSLEETIWSFQWATLRTRRHPVMRLPNCPDCRNGQSGEPPDAIVLHDANMDWNPPADLRIASAQAIIDQLVGINSPITGLLHSLERCDLASSPLIYTYGAVYHVALPPEHLRIDGAILQPGVCSGRGWTLDDAKAACLAESVERYSLQFRGDERRITAKYRDLRELAIHPDQVLLFSEDQFSNREEWNRKHVLDDAVPERFDSDEEIQWSKGWSLTAQGPRFLPLALHSQYFRPTDKRWIGDADSNGCAAGSRLEEAVLHGLLELVERDALAIFWYNQIARPAFSPKTLSDPLCRRACRQLEQQGWRVWVQDITTDLGIPVVIALAVNRKGHWIRGSSAHTHPANALRQAVCELWQLSHGRSRVTRPPTYSGLDAGELKTGSLEECSINVKELVEDCCSKLERAGHEVIVFDLTRPEIAFPVVRVVAPGLRHSKPRFGPGRLYDVPVRLGWTRKPRSEHELPTASA